MPTNMDNMLLTACKNGQKGVVQAFLKRGGVQLDKRDAQGATPLHYASAKGARDIVKLLLDAGADDGALRAAMAGAIFAKPACHHFSAPGTAEDERRSMYQIGG